MLGTRFSMQDDFCTGLLKNEYALDVIVPDADDMEELRKAFENGKDLRRQSTASTILGNAKDNLSDSATKEVLDSIIN